MNKQLTFLFQVAISFACIATLSGYSIESADSNAPITLQSLLMVWFAMLFGMRVGLTSVLLYLLVGGLGLGVFSNGASGWEHFSGATGGFLMAFPIAALVAGIASDWLKSRKNPQKFMFLSSALVLFLSQTLILILGLFWYNSIALEPISHNQFIPGLLIKTAVGTMAYVLVNRTFFRPNNQSS